MTYLTTNKYLCLGLATMLFITLLYLSAIPDWFKFVIAIIMLIVSKIGIASIELSYLKYETSLESSMLRSARKQVSIGVPDKHKATDSDDKEQKLSIEDEITSILEMNDLIVINCDRTEEDNVIKLTYKIQGNINPNLKSIIESKLGYSINLLASKNVIRLFIDKR